MELLEWWFEKNEKYWFNSNSSIDQLIYKKYFEILINTKDKPVYNLTEREILYYILLYDQVTRHIDRHLGSNYRLEYSLKALEYSKFLIETEKYKTFQPKEIIFILMPYRHTFNLSKLNYIKNIIQKLRNELGNDNYFKRFYYATINSIIKQKKPLLYNKTNKKFNQQILCDTCKKKKIINLKKFNILLYIFIYISISINLNIITILIFNILLLFIMIYTYIFLEKNENKTDLKKETIPIKIKKSLNQIDKNEALTISLSGGSDSMVCAFCLLKLGYNLKSAIMINYNNRKESDDEVEMVALWCSSMNLPLYVRKIDEISRSRDSDRSFYENITKKIRFNSYQYLENSIVLGHNWNDCFENCITNINKKNSYENLIGMNFESKQFGVKLLRPFLDINKNEINDLANTFNIPYLKDSTPKWSARGKIRDNFVDLFNNFDKNLIPGFIELSKRYKDIYSNHMNILIENTEFKKIDEKEYIIYYIKNCKLLDYWIKIYSILNIRYDIPIPSINSINNS